MAEKIINFFEAMKEKYKGEVEIQGAKIGGELENIPKELYSMYNVVKAVRLPFGEIFPVEEAIKYSRQLPFKDNWFVFGRDGYFTFWLCSYKKKEDKYSFTYWDHESGLEIEDPEWENIVEFLTYIEEEFEEIIQEN